MTKDNSRRLILTRADEITPSPFRGRGTWGPWHLDKHTGELWTEAGGYRYGIDLNTCTNSAEVLDWICQIAGKLWATDDAGQYAITAGLVNAFIDVIHPQANLCSFGQSKRLTKAQIGRLVEQGP
jgi:hypothetical protein